MTARSTAPSPNFSRTSSRTSSSALPLREKIRLLAVTGERRRPPYPTIPTFVELGQAPIPHVKFSMFIRSGTPAPVVDKLYASASYALQQPEVKKFFANINSDIVAGSQELAARSFTAESRYFTEIASRIDFKKTE